MNQNVQAEIELTDAQLEMVVGGYSQQEAHPQETHQQEQHHENQDLSYHHRKYCHWVWWHRRWIWVCNR